MSEKPLNLQSQHLKDDGQMWKYFAPMLHIDDDDLDPYQYRLLGHYRRVCGVNGGICTENTRTTADRTRMSLGKVSEARRQLAKLGRINLRATKSTIHVTLRDCWKMNILRYSACSPDEQPAPDADGCSPDEQSCSHGEQPPQKSCSPGETKNNKQEQPEEEKKEEETLLPPPIQETPPAESLVLGEEPAPTDSSPHGNGERPGDGFSPPCVSGDGLPVGVQATAPNTESSPLAPCGRGVGGEGIATLAQFYAANIGDITPHVRDELADAESEFGAEEVMHAMREAVTHNARSWAYCLAILKRRAKENLNSPPYGNGEGLGVGLETDNTAALDRFKPQPPADSPPIPASLLHIIGDDLTVHAAWEIAYNQLKLQLDASSFNLWLSGTTLADFDPATRAFTFIARNTYARDMLQHHLYRNVQRILCDVCGCQSLADVTLVFTCPSITQEAA